MPVTEASLLRKEVAIPEKFDMDSHRLAEALRSTIAETGLI